MIYSQYIDGGVVPVALALEEMGFTRYGSVSYTKSLFKTPPTESVDSTTLLRREDMVDTTTYSPAKYVMITGDKAFSPNNLADLKYATDPNNMNGEKVRVILITKAAAEGLDFKNIRQMHILEPWYNINVQSRLSDAQCATKAIVLYLSKNAMWRSIYMQPPPLIAKNTWKNRPIYMCIGSLKKRQFKLVVYQDS